MEIVDLYPGDDALKQFLSQWHDSSDYITAHTSGSTGVPKEIRLLKADMTVSAKATCRFFGINSTSHLVMPLSANYIAGKMMVVRTIVSGAKLTVLKPSRDLSPLSDLGCAIDLLPIVPSQIEALLRLPNLHNIRNVIVGGAPLSLQQECSIADSGICAYATYGMTETCSHVALRRIGHEEAFTAMPGIRFSTDPAGALIINAPEYSQHQFVTNDMAEVIDPKHFRWLGRRDNVINSGGIKIIPETIEVQLRSYLPDVDFYLTSRKSQIWGEEMVMVVATHGKKVDISAHIERARPHMPHHLLPKDIIMVNDHDYTSSGKIIRKTF